MLREVKPNYFILLKAKCRGNSNSQIEGEEIIEQRLRKAGALYRLAGSEQLNTVVLPLHLLFPKASSSSTVEARDTAWRKGSLVQLNSWEQLGGSSLRAVRAQGPLLRLSATTETFSQDCAACAKSSTGCFLG